MSCIFESYFEEVPQSTKDHCLQFPCFARLLNDDSLKPIQTPDRQPEPGTLCPFLSQTLNTEETAPACQSFYKTPGAVLCRAWITKIEGRKLWVAGRIEDENGESYTTGKGLLLRGGRVKL